MIATHVSALIFGAIPLSGFGGCLGQIHDSGSLTAILGRFFILLLLVLLNGFFVAAEFSIVKARGSRLEVLIERGDSRAQLLERIGTQLDSFLSVTQLGITVSSIALGVIAEPFFAYLLDPLFLRAGQSDPALLDLVSFAISFFTVTFLHVVLGELIPKNLALLRPLQTALFIARPLQWVHAIARPTVWVFNGTAHALLKWIFRVDSVSEKEIGHTAEELAVLVSATEKSEVTEVEKEILINALELSELEAREIMLPRNKVIVLDINDGFEKNFAKAIESRHTRFPLVNGHLDRTLGLIHVKDLMQISRIENPDLKSIIRPLELVPERMAADLLLKRFLSSRAHMALVVDEYGGSLGIVTLDNVVEELIGDINDEFDEGEMESGRFARLNDDAFEVDGTLPMYELAERQRFGVGGSGGFDRGRVRDASSRAFAQSRGTDPSRGIPRHGRRSRRASHREASL